MSYSRDQHGLVLSVLQHVAVGVVSNGEQVRGHLVLPLSSVLAHHLASVDWQTLVGVDSHTEQAGVGLLYIERGRGKKSREKDRIN